MFVLGLLARHGPLHGHALRQMAHQDHTEMWSEVKVGSLYSALRQLTTEGLLVAERTEQMGRLPTRTVYAITAAGRRELERVRRAVLLDAELRPDPFDLALALSDQAPGQDLTDLVRRRRDSIRAQMGARAQLKAKAWPQLSEAEREVFHHYEHRYQAELSWHDQLLERMPRLSAPTPGGVDAGGSGAPTLPAPRAAMASAPRRLPTPTLTGSRARFGAGDRGERLSPPAVAPLDSPAKA